MKYFTLDWWMDWDNPNYQDVCSEYQKYYDSIKAKLPVDLRKLYEEVSLHDGNLVKLSSDFEKIC